MSFLSTLSAETAARRQSLRQHILTLSFGLPNRDAFDSLALAVFRYQAVYNPLYAAYLHYLNVLPETISDLRQIPFMPIIFFKTHTVLTGIDTNQTLANLETELTFASSGTTDHSLGPMVTSRHLVPDPDLYEAISTRIFEQTYGPLSNFHILALLPSYLERNNSSLVYMVQQFMDRSGRSQANTNQSGFFLHNHRELTERLRQLAQQPDQKRILLIGVTFGLLDWAESEPDLSFLGQFPDLIVMETGGMKGRRKELLREEVHEILTGRLGVKVIHSEYGMTELLSQAYSAGSGIFSPSSTLRIFLRDINDPFSLFPDNTLCKGERRTGSRQTGSRQTGGINVVDLANLDSCSFIETQDLGQYVDNDEMTSSAGSAGESTAPADGSFRVIGRFDNSDVRGCNLMTI